MILEVLISTIDGGIEKIPDILLDEREDVRYLVSWQIRAGSQELRAESEFLLVNKEWARREDVKVFTMKGQGLSRNRNNALLHATGDILLIADDDCHYTNEYFDNILSSYKEHPEADIILFKGNLNKAYPEKEMTLKKALRHRGYFVSSVEMTMRKLRAESQKLRGILFNEEFGLGSGKYICGEEDVFLKDAEKAGQQILFVPKMIVETDPNTTGKQQDNPEVLRAKRAALTYCYGKFRADYIMLKEKIMRKLRAES